MVETKIVREGANSSDNEKLELIFDKEKVLEGINLGIKALNSIKGTNISAGTRVDFVNNHMYIQPLGTGLGYSGLSWVLADLISVVDFAHTHGKPEGASDVTKIDFTSFKQKDIVKFIELWMSEIGYDYKHNSLRG